MRHILGLLFFGALILPVTSNAATLYIDPGIATIYRGDAITLAVRLMPDQAAGECINAADVVIEYPESIQPVDVSIGRSIFSVWIESPVINKENRTITFAGGIPNGYCGRVQGDPGLTNVLADIVFRSPGLQIGAPQDGGEAVVSFSPETQLYLNDGQGTKASLVTLPSTITLEKGAGSGIVDPWRESVQNDEVPPESFSIQLEKGNLEFTGRYYIIFSTTDKQTGVSHFEVIEEPLADFGSFSWGAADAPWTRATSPYVLKDQSLNSTIRVRAYDKAGNEYTATLVPDITLRTTSPNKVLFYVSLGVGVLVLMIIIITVIVVVKRRRKKEVSEDDSSEALNDEDII